MAQRLLRGIARCLLVLCVVCVPAAKVRAQQPSVGEQYLFDAINTARSAAGLPALRWSEGLGRAAAEHADQMRKQDALSHQFEGEADLPDRASASDVHFTQVSENVGVGESSVHLHTEWMNSPDHRENILDPQVNAVGISLRGNPGELWAVEDFAKIVVDLSLPEQERQVEQLLRATGLHSVGGTQDARETCGKSGGYTGGRPAFVMRFTSTDLTRLPAQLASRIAQGGISGAAVGACDTGGRKRFAMYSIAIVLYR